MDKVAQINHFSSKATNEEISWILPDACFDLQAIKCSIFFYFTNNIYYIHIYISIYYTVLYTQGIAKGSGNKYVFKRVFLSSRVLKINGICNYWVTMNSTEKQSISTDLTLEFVVIFLYEEMCKQPLHELCNIMTS